MPGIKISKSIRALFPDNERNGVEDFLWSKAGGVCFLCDEAMNLATDDIEADHDEPQSTGGATDRSNLNLVHVSCNRAKKNSPTINVRPYLRLKAFAHKRGNVIGYADVQEHFGFAPRESIVVDDGCSPFVKWHLPESKIVETSVFTEIDGDGTTYRYTFVEVPREALFNDDECQPRNIKLNQAWAIYADIESNPLHEPPSCRLLPQPGGKIELAMFDGQHKSVALWMHGRKTAVVKVYLNLNREQTIRLVGSIQSRIKKLPLSSFEHALKMGEEWAAHAEEYEAKVGIEEASEAGLIQSLPAQDRKRAKDAFQAQLLRDVLGLDELKFLQFVQRDGKDKQPIELITETAFKNKVVAQLRHTAPLNEKGEEWQKARARELENIRFALNTLIDTAFLDAEGGTELTGQDATRRDRMKYQSSLTYIAGLIRKLFRQVLNIDEESRAMLEKEPNAEEKQRIQTGIQRIASHPIWTCDWERSPATVAVREALTKNQDAANAFRAVELRGDYVTGQETLPSNWYE